MPFSVESIYNIGESDFKYGNSIAPDICVGSG